MLRNRTFAGMASSAGTRSSARLWSSTVVPTQTFAGALPASQLDAGPKCSGIGLERSNAAAASSRSCHSSGRLESNCQSSRGVDAISSSKSANHSAGTSGSNQSDSEEQNTLRRTPSFAAARFHANGLFRVDSLASRRGLPVPHSTPKILTARLTWA